MTLPPWEKLSSAWLSSWWKRMFLRWLRWEKKQVGNEALTRCYRQFTAKSGILISFLTSTDETSHEAFPFFLHLSRLPWLSPTWWSLPDKWRQLPLSLPPLLLPFLLSLSALKQRRLQPCSRSDACPVASLDASIHPVSKTQSSHSLF